jgi:anti-anti-sigma regulatory factor
MREEHDTRHEHLPVILTSRSGQFSVSSIREARRVVVRACGRLVLGHGAHRPTWTSHLDVDAGTSVALDLSCVNDVDARGVGVLADLVRRSLQQGVTMSVIAASGVVQRVAELTRLNRALPGTWSQQRGALSCVDARRNPIRTHLAAPHPICRAGDHRSVA